MTALSVHTCFYGAHKGTLSVVIFFISFVRNTISFVRNFISFVRNIISFVRNIISFVRNVISFVRNDLVCTKYYFVCTKWFRLCEMISFVRNIISFVRNIITFVRNNISFVRNNISFARNIISFVRNDLGLSLTDRLWTWIWHSLTGQSEWILLYVAFCTIMAISRQKEARSRDYALLLFQITSRVLYSARYHLQHCTFHASEQFGALYMHYHDAKYQARPGFEPGTSRLQAPVDTNEPSGPATNRAGTCVWHSLTWQGLGSRPVSECQTQIPALSVSVTPRSPPCQWVSDPGPRPVSECHTQVPA